MVAARCPESGRLKSVSETLVHLQYKSRWYYKLLLVSAQLPAPPVLQAHDLQVRLPTHRSPRDPLLSITSSKQL